MCLARRTARAWQTVAPLSSSWSRRPSWELFSATADKPSTQPSSLKGIEYLKEHILDILNEIADPKEVARQTAMAKIAKKKKKKKEITADEEAAFIEEAVQNAPDTFTLSDTAVTTATRAEFGDYQCNAALALGGRKVAEQIIERIDLDIFEEPTMAGPGFINFRLTDGYLEQAVRAMACDLDRLGMAKTTHPQRIVVDFSSPNIAKEMHVGHLRSTIIGDTLCNVLEFLGHSVVRLNHVGDWGTQFGMLVEHLRDNYPEALDPTQTDTVNLGDLVELYKAAKKRFDVDKDFKVRAREGVVKLQAGDPEARAAWQALCAASRVEFETIYEYLNVENLEERGESFYNPFLNDVVTDLESLGLAVESEGATAVFLDGYSNRDGTPLPLLVKKSDGGFNYATTDLAAIRQRTTLDDGEHADRVLYVTDAGQAQHFRMVFEAAKKAGFVSSSSSLEHVPFGLVQGADGKKFATRSGDTVKLKDLLNEAIKIAGDDLKSRSPDSQELQERVDAVARTVGIGAVKYADLSLNRESNYKFSYERMLSLNGNTAPYMLYAHARICGIVRKATGQDDSTPIVWPKVADTILIEEDAERELIRTLAKFPDIMHDVERYLYPSRICDYLFDCSQKFNQFYEKCSVNNAGSEELKASRLSICTATAATLRRLLHLLGIETVEKL